MNVKELKEKIIKNGGLTLKNDLKESEEKQGYYVSKIGKEKIINYDILEESIKEYQKELLKNEYIGLWVYNGALYIDITKHYKDKKEAIKNGIKNKQFAIFDIKNNCDIKLLKDTYILYKYNRFKNDIQYIKEYYSINDIKDLFSDIKYIHQFINNSIDTLDLHILKDKYIIVKDNCYYREYLEIIEG